MCTEKMFAPKVFEDLHRIEEYLGYLKVREIKSFVKLNSKLPQT